MLAALLSGSVTSGNVRSLRPTGFNSKRLPVAGLLQQHPEPCDIHGVLARVQAGLQEDALRWYKDNSLTVDLSSSISLAKEWNKIDLRACMSVWMFGTSGRVCILCT